MPFKRSACLLVMATIMLAAPVSAQITGRPIEVSGGVGGFIPDGRARMQTGIASQGTLGWRLIPGLTLEGHATFGPSHADTLPNQKHNFMQAGVDLRWNLRDAESRVVPYALTGVGYGLSHTTGHAPEKLARGSADLGLGLLQNVFNQRTYLRFEVRDMMFRERDALEFSNHIAATVGLQYVFGGKVHDSDLDGVRDWLDTCPNTPIGAHVDPHGCPIDSDADSVYDGLDKCPGTPKGCTVDKDGCPSDQDGDGVCDGLDQCADTPKGATVDAAGCPKDSDGDGVLDGIDQCADTGKGCKVDSLGCPHDTDGDGVCDGLDVCPNTPPGLRVDARGCPIEVTEKETQLLDTGMIRLQNVQFDTGKATIKPASTAVLDTVGMILVQYPTLNVEIGGHTDNTGTAAKNLKLSDDRAAAVLSYLTQKFPLINKSQFTSKGYGQSAPIAPNGTTLGRAKNRRVEFKVTNPGALRVERERRRFAPKTEGAPSDTTKKIELPPPDTAPKQIEIALPDTSMKKIEIAPPDTSKRQTAAPDTTRKP